MAEPSITLTRVYRSLTSLDEEGDFVVGDIDNETDWSMVVKNQHLVIHTAARAHIKRGESWGPLSEYRRVNVDGTLNLARQAAAAGVHRFIFISSVGVNGGISASPFTESDTPNPVEPYTQSKLEAEKGLWRIHHDTGMELVIIRPPLVYGANAPGNFRNLVRLINKGIPIPLGCVSNHRSLVGIDNLVDFIATCMGHPSAANQVFLVADGEDTSTSELLRSVAKAMGRPCRLVPIPSTLLRFVAELIGKKAFSRRLLGNLQVDTSKAREKLGWTPPISLEEGLRRCFEDQIAKDIHE
jgi:nucleoside-diphosphate-sugar epimerase